MTSVASRRLGWSVPLVVVTAIVFGRIVWHDWVEFDDTIHVTENAHFFPVTASRLAAFWRQSFHHLYVPMSYMLYAAECVASRWLHGDGPTAAVRPGLFHAVSLLLHTAASLLVYRLLRRYAAHDWVAAVGSLVFAIHPLQVESVAWVAEQRGLLAAVLSLVAIDRFLHWLDHEGGTSYARPSYVLATVAFGLALLSKPTAIVIPLAAFALALGGTKAAPMAIARSLVPWAGMACAAAVTTRLAQPPDLTRFSVPLVARPLVAADAIAFYAAKVFVPVDLCVAYGRSPRVTLADPRAPIGALAVALGIVAVMLLPRCREWRLPTSLFLIPLVPVLGFTSFVFQNQSTVADRYAYLAMLGPALAVARCCGIFEPLLRSRTLWRIAAGSGLIGLVITTSHQVAMWRDTGTLSACACRVTPGDTGAWTMLAGHFLATGEAERALECAHRALHVAPGNEVALLNAFGAAVRLGRSGEAADTYARLREQDYDDGRLLTVFYNRGVSHLKAGRYTEAAIDFGIALERVPTHPWAATNLGVTLTRLGRYDEAVTVLRASLDHAPEHAAGWVALGNVLLTQGSAVAAVEAYTRALAIEPDDAATLVNRAWARLDAGDRAGARRDAETALSLGHPADADPVRFIQDSGNAVR